MMPRKRKESDTMIEFVLHELSAEDQEIASAIRPLPASVMPSEQVIKKIRAQILEATEATKAGPRAA